ncbi:MAG: HDOD domain-containing protein [Polyangiaceae bacterium]|nr:HDOD domain-containing protein [Polyangiaceae bacterium]
MTSEEAHERLVAALAKGIGDLPMLPRAATEMMRLAQSQDVDFAEVRRVAEGHPPLAARLLATANSVLYSRGSTVGAVQAAIVRLGAQATRDILFQASYATALLDGKEARAFLEERFVHSGLAARVARMLAPRFDVSGDTAYVCGLLHDVGEARCARVAARAFKEGWDDAVLAAIDRLHCQAGGDLAVRWRLPAEIERVARHHHDEAPEDPLVRVVAVADRLAELYTTGGLEAGLPALAERSGQDLVALLGVAERLEAEASTLRMAA